MRKVASAVWRWVGHASSIHLIWSLGAGAVLTALLRLVIHLGFFWFMLFFFGISLVLAGVLMRWGPLAKYNKLQYTLETVTVPIPSREELGDSKPDEMLSPPRPRFTHAELVKREQNREFVTTKLAEGAQFRRSRMMAAITSTAMAGPPSWEIKWIEDTYYGLRDREPQWAESFGHPEWDKSSFEDRMAILRDILDTH